MGVQISRSPFTAIGVAAPILAAPMAGGPSTPELVEAAGRAGGLGFVAAGYKTADALAEQVAAARASGVAFGVNLFAPNPIPITPNEYRAYARLLQPEADRYALDLSAIELREDDDLWNEKVSLLLTDPVPVVSFTFGIPSSQEVAAFRRAGTITVQTVTSAAEARLAAEAGVDVLVVQATAAGGHSGTLTPLQMPAAIPLTELVARVAAVASIPIIGAGGIASSADVAAALHAGATAVSVGTLLLRADESGASETHRTALANPAFDSTVVTRAFTGRPARALRNSFTDRFGESAPAGYPALHHLTGPLRKAAVAAGDPQGAHLWAGTGYRSATAEPLADILGRLSSAL
ncbi:nitronate monooxygenase [Agromyces laixinhei]|uniref:nitronate monooxygenase n=1 Tax=Agromyces laixinhei TaxID=2585717 RepID=UPI001E4C02F8|nr:nitronate monooxygenase [Agromyces laixinhei]